MKFHRKRRKPPLMPPALRDDFLFARPSFFEGMARVMDFGNTLNIYNLSRNGAEADFIAIRNDWRMVAQDLKEAVAKLEKENKIKK